MSHVRRTRDANIAHLILDRPDARNALSADMCDSIAAALDEIVADGDARAIVIRGEGKVFCSGADFAAVSGPGAIDFLPAFEGMLEKLGRVPLPTIASIQGAALGGGFQLASVCDFRVATSDAKIGIPASRFGILVNFENIERLVLLAGIAVAKEVLFTGRTYSGVEAEARRLVHSAVPPQDLHATVRDLAHELTARAPLSMRGAKVAIQAVIDHLAGARGKNAVVVAAVDDLVRDAYNSADLAEGLAAMTEKREPRFEGR